MKYLFGFHVEHLSYNIRLIISILGLFISWIIYSLIQETIWKVERFPYKLFLTLLQFIFQAFLSFYALKQSSLDCAHHFSLFDVVFNGDRSQGRVQFALQAVIAGCTLVIQRLFGNWSFVYLDYSTKLLFQSSKLIPVMLLGVFFFRKRFSLLEYFAALLICGGLGRFLLASQKTTSGSLAPLEDDTSYFSSFTIGVLLMSVSLLCESLKPNFLRAMSDIAKKNDFFCSQETLVFNINIVGGIVLFPLVLCSGELQQGMVLLASRWILIAEIVLMFVFGYIGSIFTISLVQLSGAMISSTASATRKLISITLSFLLFGKPMTIHHIFASAIFFSGIAAQLYAKKQKTLKL